MGAITHLTGACFEDAVRSDGLVLVDFWADWCAPCRAISPILEEIAEMQDRVRIMKLDIDTYPDVPRRLGIMSIPTLILFAGGEERMRWVGLRGKEELVRGLELLRS
jgi:thioredoxin 1